MPGRGKRLLAEPGHKGRRRSVTRRPSRPACSASPTPGVTPGSSRSCPVMGPVVDRTSPTMARTSAARSPRTTRAGHACDQAMPGTRGHAGPSRPPVRRANDRSGARRMALSNELLVVQNGGLCGGRSQRLCHPVTADPKRERPAGSECLLARFGTDAAAPRLTGRFPAAAAKRGRRPLRGGGGLAGDEDQFEAGTLRRAPDICQLVTR